jgi:uncharacterized protein
MAAVLDLRPNCELCNRDLPPDSIDAMICTFGCNCDGGFTPRPPSTQRVRHHGALLARYRDVPPERR